MNWEQVKGNWKEFQGKLRAKWGKLTDNDLEVIAGKKDQLVGKLQKAYGYEKDKAEKEVDDLLSTWETVSDGVPTSRPRQSGPACGEGRPLVSHAQSSFCVSNPSQGEKRMALK